VAGQGTRTAGGERFISEDSERRLELFASTIHDEEERLARKMSEGVSVSAQVLADLIGDKLREKLSRNADGVKSAQSHSAKSWPPFPIREMAREVDLERDYDLVYWLQSIFAHAHPLSILEAHPSDWEHLLCPLFTCEATSGMPRALCLVALPSSSLHVFQAIDESLNLGLGAKIEEAWKAIHSLLQDEQNGALWQPSFDIPMGEVHVHYVDGSSKKYVPKRRSKKPDPRD
jgi:hypothetical protein